MEITHYLNNKTTRPPSNHAELSIELNFDQDSQERAVSVTRWEWINESADQDKHPEAVIDNIIQPYGRGYGDALYDIFVKLKEIMK